MTNAIRHGGARSPDDEVGVHAALREAVLRLEVTDPGPGFEPGGHGPRPDGGYGLHLLDRLATRWGVTGGEPGDGLGRAGPLGQRPLEQVRHDPRRRAPDQVAVDLVGVGAERHPAAHQPAPRVAAAARASSGSSSTCPTSASATTQAKPGSISPTNG